MTTVYEIKRGDSPWKIAAMRLGGNATNSQIANEVKKLPSIYGCKSMEEFQKKYFSRVGNKIEINFNGKKDKEPTNKSIMQQFKDTMRARVDTTQYEVRDAIKIDSSQDSVKRQHQKTINRGNNLTLKQRIDSSNMQDWDKIKTQQDKINNLKSDKDKIITYNRDIAHIKDNYIIIDKKNYTATVYNPQGKVVKQYEIGVSNNVSDQLIVGNGRGGWKVRATSAGIYTANYRANGRDSYARTYNDRILTLSNDGLKEKGVGNGETGVALHQVPNGRGGQVRAEKLRRPGVSAENNRFSAGCVNFLPEEFDDCMQQIKGVGTKVYILPEDNNNYFCVKNGNLHFAQKNYTANVTTTTTKNDPIKQIRITAKDSDMRYEGRCMALTLSNFKDSLTKSLGIDNDTYNFLAMETLGIAGAETRYGYPLANLGKGRPYYIKENCQKLVDKKKEREGNHSYNSRGITQLKIESYTDPQVKSLMKQYGITPDNVHEPENAAIGTMITLSCIYKNELPALKSLIEELGLTTEEALLYCFNGKKSEIRNKTATPDKNDYIQSVKKYKNDFQLKQSV